MNDNFSPVHIQRLLDQARDVLRVKHYSYQTEKSYLLWIRRFIHFDNRQHPQNMGGSVAVKR